MLTGVGLQRDGAIGREALAVAALEGEPVLTVSSFHRLHGDPVEQAVTLCAPPAESHSIQRLVVRTDASHDQVPVRIDLAQRHSMLQGASPDAHGIHDLGLAAASPNGNHVVPRHEVGRRVRAGHRTSLELRSISEGADRVSDGALLGNDLDPALEGDVETGSVLDVDAQNAALLELDAMGPVSVTVEVDRHLLGDEVAHVISPVEALDGARENGERCGLIGEANLGLVRRPSVEARRRVSARDAGRDRAHSEGGRAPHHSNARLVRSRAIRQANVQGEEADRSTDQAHAGASEHLGGGEDETFGEGSHDVLAGRQASHLERAARVSRRLAHVSLQSLVALPRLLERLLDGLRAVVSAADRLALVDVIDPTSKRMLSLHDHGDAL